MLADGLQQFIGYDKTGGKIKPEKGIAVSNLPVERLRDSVLMFIGPFLGVLRYTHPELKNKYATQLGNAVEACKKGVGCGKTGFDEALAEVQTELQKVSVLSGGINEVLNKVKAVEQLKSQSNVNEFATKVKDYFNGVLGKVEKDNSFTGQAETAKQQIRTLTDHLGTLVENVGSQKDSLPINVGQSNVGNQTGLKEHIDEIYKAGSGTLTALRNAFIKLSSSQHKAAYALSAAAYNGANLFVTVLQTDYTSYYKGARWDQVSGGNQPQTCAKIFLACLPLILNGLSYFYWKCSDRGGWKTMTLGSPESKAFMGLTSIGSNRVKSGLTGSDVLSKAFQKFEEFKTAANGSSTSYADFLKKFKGNSLTTLQSTSTTANGNDYFLSGLYLCSTSYFRHQHQKKAATPEEGSNSQAAVIHQRDALLADGPDRYSSVWGSPGAYP
ncbi:variant erythrocyte surface antigen-1 family protein [Babesia caballi]|uniref:Variant erythrocyte surface antigen-1 family protein n=1 Tax=Babesia caballi TaxID=5871 RepID=A0AAV4LXH1_BABCB|nr:variant erythrocyte surface antigen-1 family protein [Babesia caballi]